MTTCRVMEFLAKRGELAGVVEAVAHRSPRNEHFYSGIVGKLRARVFQHSPYQRARKAGLPAIIYHSSRRPQLEEFLQTTRPDVCVVASFPCLISDSLFSLVPLGFINIHFSLLPEFRGPAAILWEAITFAQTAGVTIHQLDAGEDTGDILRQEAFRVEAGLESEAFYARHLEIGLRLLGQTLDEFKLGRVRGIRQNHLPCKIRARRLKPDEDVIDWANWPIERAYHLLRAGHKWYVPPRLRCGWRALFDWRATSYEICHHAKRPGSLGWDLRGHYFAHVTGKIRLRAQLSLRKAIWRVIVRMLSGKNASAAALKLRYSTAIAALSWRHR